MSSVKLTADSGGGTVELKAPATTTSNGAKVITLSQNPGMVTQVLSTSKTDAFETNSTSYTDITGLSVTITPASTSSKILVMMQCVIGNASSVATSIRIVRDSTAIHVGDAAGSRIQATAGTADDPSGEFPYQCAGTFLDSPSTTSATTYKVQMITEPSGNTGYGYLNRSGLDYDNNQHGRYASSITVMEISG